MLHKFSDNIDTVFIPKVESRNDLTIFTGEFGDTHKLNLIVETRKGVDNIDEILSSKFKDSVEFVFFGNYDFHLDNNIFPITEQHTLDYWKMVEPIISKIESHEMSYGNSPYANIADTGCLDFTVMQLTKLCKRNFALMSLHKTQTIFFQKLIDEWCLNKVCSDKFNHDGFTLDAFTTNRQKGRSFALDNKRIITPQEYLLLFRKQHG